jgi:hypothetical protein
MGAEREIRAIFLIEKEKDENRNFVEKHIDLNRDTVAECIFARKKKHVEEGWRIGIPFVVVRGGNVTEGSPGAV